MRTPTRGVAVGGAILSLCACVLVPSLRESDHITRRIRSIPGVTFVNVYGWQEPVWKAKGGLYADVIVNDETKLSFAEVGYSSIGDDATQIVLYEVGGFRPLTVACLAVPSPDGPPSNPRRRMARHDFHKNGLFGKHLSPPTLNIVETIERQQEIRSVLKGWPRCPEYWEFHDAERTHYRYCSNVEGSHFLPPWPPGCETSH